MDRDAAPEHPGPSIGGRCVVRGWRAVRVRLSVGRCGGDCLARSIGAWRSLGFRGQIALSLPDRFAQDQLQRTAGSRLG